MPERKAILLIAACFLAGSAAIYGVTTDPAAIVVVAIPTSVAALVWLTSRESRDLRLWRRGVCPGCGYELKGLVEVGCPECGWGRRAW